MAKGQNTGAMTSQERFRQTMDLGSPDHVPCFEEGIREEVVNAWRTQGLPGDKRLSDVFPYDMRREIIVDLEPHPKLEKLPTSKAELDALRKRLDPTDPKRLTKNWARFAETCQTGGHALMLRVHSGFFLTMGVSTWSRFMEVMNLIIDYPDIAREIMVIQGKFCAGVTERVLGDMDIDAAIFSEPIGGNDKPLISPAMYEQFVLSSYEPVLDTLKKHGVPTLVFRTYANARVLIPSILKWGFNCLWACEAGIEAMDYRGIRREFGSDLRLIGGIDLSILRQSKAAIKREVEDKVPGLLAEGGYVPLADGRVREDVPFENYAYYRQVLQEVTGQGEASRSS